MSRKSTIAWILIGLAALLSLAVLFDPTHTLLGLILGDSFYRWRPTSYWREIIAADGKAGHLQQTTLEVFDSSDAVTVLRECLAYPDPNVRWPSVVLFQRCATYDDQVRAFQELVDDPDRKVRLQSIIALGRLRREALSALPRLSQLVNSADPGVAIAARYSIWNIDPEFARETENWEEFCSDEWGFSACFPGKVETDSQKAKYIDSDLHQYWAWSGVSRFTVAVSFVLPNVAMTVEDRYELAPHITASALEGKVECNDRIEQDGLTGRDQKIVAERTVLRTRAYVVGDRVYQAQVAYEPALLHPDAVDFFLNSFTITWRPEE